MRCAATTTGAEATPCGIVFRFNSLVCRSHTEFRCCKEALFRAVDEPFPSCKRTLFARQWSMTISTAWSPELCLFQQATVLCIVGRRSSVARSLKGELGSKYSFYPSHVSICIGVICCVGINHLCKARSIPGNEIFPPFTPAESECLKYRLVKSFAPHLLILITDDGPMISQ